MTVSHLKSVVFREYFGSNGVFECKIGNEDLNHT